MPTRKKKAAKRKTSPRKSLTKTAIARLEAQLQVIEIELATERLDDSSSSSMAFILRMLDFWSKKTALASYYARNEEDPNLKSHWGAVVRQADKALQEWEKAKRVTKTKAALERVEEFARVLDAMEREKDVLKGFA